MFKGTIDINININKENIKDIISKIEKDEEYIEFKEKMDNMISDLNKEMLEELKQLKEEDIIERVNLLESTFNKMMSKQEDGEIDEDVAEILSMVKYDKNKNIKEKIIKNTMNLINSLNNNV